MKGNRILFFDILRVLSIGLVFFGHLVNFVGVPYLKGFFGVQNFYWVTIAGFGVTLFLITSGCVIAYNHTGFSNFRQVIYFYINRFIRVYPAYWLAIIAILLLFLMFIGSYVSNLSVIDYLITLSGFAAFLNQWGGPIIDVGWFVGLIMSLYLLYPLLLYFFNKNPLLTIAALFIISFVSRILIGQLSAVGIGYRSLDWFPTCRLFEFGIGIFIIKNGWYLKEFNISRLFNNIIIFFSNISFYVYLIHYSFFDGRIYNVIHLNKYLYIVISMVVIAILSIVLFYADANIQKAIKKRMAKIYKLQGKPTN